MKKIWMASRNILLILVFTAVSEALVWLAVNFTSGEMIVPQPETVAENFTSELAGHRWSGAMGELSEELQSKVKAEDLQKLMQKIEQSHPEIEHVHGKSEQKQNDQASAVATFIFAGQIQEDVAYTLVLENHLWKISSIEGLKRLAGQ